MLLDGGQRRELDHRQRGATGSGIGSVTFAVELNPTAASRSGTLTVAGQTVSVTQEAGSCTYSVTPTSFTVDRVAGSRTVSIVCGNAMRLVGDDPGDVDHGDERCQRIGYRGGDVRLRGELVDTPRTGVVSIGGQAVTITQTTLPAAGHGSTDARQSARRSLTEHEACSLLEPKGAEPARAAGLL